MLRSNLTSAIPRHSLAGGLCVLILLCTSTSIEAHPLGNENVEHFSILLVYPDRLELDLMILLAETPSLLVVEQMDTDGDDIASIDEQAEWLESKARQLLDELDASLDGRPIRFQLADVFDEPPREGQTPPARRIIIESPGFAGLPTYQLLIQYTAMYDQPVGAGRHVLTYEDRTFRQNPGLKRIILNQTPDVRFLPPHPPFLNEIENPTDYAQYDPASLPQERQATITFVVDARPDTHSAGASVGTGQTPPLPGAAPEVSPGDPGPSGNERQGETPSARAPATPMAAVPSKSQFQQQAEHMMALLQGQWGITVLVSVTLLCLGWGAAHALMPGHAKTVVAAYLISQNGTYVHAILLAIIVTLTHTALVVVLGLIWAAYQASNPSLGPRLQLWLGLVSGLLVAGMGIVLMWRALTGRLAHHHHDHDHHHHHHDHDEPRSWWRRLFTHSHPNVPGHDHHGHTEHDHHHGAHDHHRDHARGHHHDHEHHHTHSGETTASVELDYAAKPPGKPATLSYKSVVVLGVAGGIVPCPTATIIMLLGIGADIALRALFAVAVFSLGLALTLMAVGFLALSSRRFAGKLMREEQSGRRGGGRSAWLMLTLVPSLSGLAVTVLGGLIALNYLYRMQFGTALVDWLS